MNRDRAERDLKAELHALTTELEAIQRRSLERSPSGAIISSFGTAGPLAGHPTSGQVSPGPASPGPALPGQGSTTPSLPASPNPSPQLGTGSAPPRHLPSARSPIPAPTPPGQLAPRIPPTVAPPSRSTAQPPPIPLADDEAALEQLLDEKFQQIQAQVDHINQLADRQEEAVLELKAIAESIEYQLEEGEQDADQDWPPVCYYDAATLPWVTQDPNGSYVVTSRPLDWFKAEKNAHRMADHLRHVQTIRQQRQWIQQQEAYRQAQQQQTPPQPRQEEESNLHPILDWLQLLGFWILDFVLDFIVPLVQMALLALVNLIRWGFRLLGRFFGIKPRRVPRSRTTDASADSEYSLYADESTSYENQASQPVDPSMYPPHNASEMSSTFTSPQPGAYPTQSSYASPDPSLVSPSAAPPSQDSVARSMPNSGMPAPNSASARSPEGRSHRPRKRRSPLAEAIGFDSQESVLWVIGGAIGRLGLEMIMIQIPMLRPALIALVVISGAIAIHRLIVNPQMGWKLGYRLLLLLIGLMLGGWV